MKYEIGNDAYWFSVTTESTGHVIICLDDKQSGLRIADGPCIYRASGNINRKEIKTGHLETPVVSIENRSIIIRGKLLGLTLNHTFTLPEDKPVMEERITVSNPGNSLVSLKDIEIGMTKCVINSGQTAVLPELANDRVVAIPFRYREGNYFDYSIDDLVNKPSFLTRVINLCVSTTFASSHRISEGWAWTHGEYTLGIFSFNQGNMIFSVISQVIENEGKFLRIGGAVMIDDEPAALGRIAPGQSVDLGIIRYETVRGNYMDSIYRYRKMLDEKGCRFPAEYNPPVHWEQLFDMNGAWDDRPNKFTKSIIETQAEKGRDYSCEALYLDPGWDTDFGTFIWGEQWLGPRKQFIEDIRVKYGLKVALHFPMATWMSNRLTWSVNSVNSWPKESHRKIEIAPALRDGCRNLSLLPAAKANVSSELDWYNVSNLIDGVYGAETCWIAKEQVAWAEVDLGEIYSISRVILGNDHTGYVEDQRQATGFDVLVAVEYNSDSNASTWKKVAEYRGTGLLKEESFLFSPVQARWVRIDIRSVNGEKGARIDEIEIYEAEQVTDTEAESFKSIAKRGTVSPIVCLGSKQYLDEAEKRILANCADGIVFIMFDGVSSYRSGCFNINHGHPVPYQREDHIRALIDITQRVHAKYPEVFIEMHDMISGGVMQHAIPIYYKYSLPGSYNELWGFELMWDMLNHVKSGEAKMLYYAVLGCNVPVYLHINLAQDNEYLIGFWWYASTCRHLGIGGTHQDLKIVESQKLAMKQYRKLERFYKRGEFFGISEEIHLHVIPDENVFMVNVFNISDTKRTVSGSIELQKIGVDPRYIYNINKKEGTIKNGIFNVACDMEPWSTQLIEVAATNIPQQIKPGQ